MVTQNQVTDPKLRSLFQEIHDLGASDIHLVASEVARYRVGGEIHAMENADPFSEEELEAIARELGGQHGCTRLAQRGSFDGAVSDDKNRRYRFNIYRCGGRTSMAFRRLDDRFQSLTELGLPEDLGQVCEWKDGMIVVAGPTGSGKSTTLATLIHQINDSRKTHIITIEDPVEYVHQNRMSLVSQRQIGADTDSFANALRDAVRQDPDVILVGEMRDLDTIRTAVMAAETGHLVFATVHASDCTSAIERVISVFPGDEQTMIRHLLAGSLRTVIAQHLLVSDSTSGRSGSRHLPIDGRPSRNRVLASEVLHVNRAASNLIASDNLTQIQSILETSRIDGMYTLDHSLARLWRRGLITEMTARSIARNPSMLRELSRAIG